MREELKDMKQEMRGERVIQITATRGEGIVCDSLYALTNSGRIFTATPRPYPDWVEVKTPNLDEEEEQDARPSA